MLIAMAISKERYKGEERKILAKTPELKYTHLQEGGTLATPTSDKEVT